MRRCLDREIYPEFGDDRVASIGPREIIEYDRKLRARGLSESGTANVCKPLRGLLDHAVLGGDITVSPYRQVPKGKLSSCNTRRRHHEWTTEQVEDFIRTAYGFDEREMAQRSYGLQVELMVRLGSACVSPKPRACASWTSTVTRTSWSSPTSSRPRQTHLLPT